MVPLLDLVLKEVSPPKVDDRKEFSMLITTIDWSKYVGRIAIGKIQSGTVSKGQTVGLVQADGKCVSSKISTVYVFDKLGRTEVDTAVAGDVVALVGIDGIEIGDTITDPNNPIPQDRLAVDEPTWK